MKASLSQKQDSNSQANANQQAQAGIAADTPFVDNRPETLRIKEIQNSANNSAQVRQSKALQKMADNNAANHTSAAAPVQRRLSINGVFHSGTSGLGTPLTVARGTNVQSMIDANATLSFASVTEMMACQDQLDTLLGGAGNPANIREAIISQLTGIGNLGTAVTNIVTTAAVPMGDRVELLNEVNNDIELLSRLLTEATLASRAGTPGLRLRRVFDANPGTRTFAGLQPFIAAQKDIDDKILRGKVDGAGLIGGHSQAITNNPDFYITRTVNNPNTTDYVSFKKLLRSDASGFAAAVQTNAPHNIVADILVQTGIGDGIAAAPPALINPAMLPAKDAAKRAATQAKSVAAIQTASAQVQTSVGAARAAAAAAAAATTNATALGPFVEAMDNLCNQAQTLLRAAVLAETNTGTTAGAAALAALGLLIANYAATGPKLSAKKNSTFAPAGMSDDDILKAGDLTAAIPATLIRDRGRNGSTTSGHTFADNTQVDSMHQRLAGGIVWVAVKEGVTLRIGHPSTLTGGRLTSSYPTGLTAIPADPAAGVPNADGFAPLP